VSRRLFAVALGCLWVGVLSCSESTSPNAPPVQQPESADILGLGGLSGLLSCSVTTTESAVATIGSEGGTLTVGAHSLRVPPGALTSTVTISAQAPAGSVVRVALQPEGLQFEQPAVLTLSYAGCGLLWNFLPKRIAYTTDALAILSYLLSWDNLWARRVSGRIDHFSTYAIAW
jgi:hypothetical protein